MSIVSEPVLPASRSYQLLGLEACKMNNSVLLRVILIAVIAFIAFRVVTWLLGVLTGVLTTAIMLAVVIGVIWLLFQIFGQRKAY